MTSSEYSERTYGSTRWVAAGERLSSSARGKTQHARRAYRWFGLRTARASEDIQITVRYRAGAECYYLVQARGRHGIFPGIVSLHDVMREVRQA